MSAVDSTFYVTGGTLRHDAPSYVERQADKDLLDGLLKGEFCYVLTSRQMGKSSLMVRTAGKLREHGVRVAVLDLTAVGQPEAKEQWYFGLLTRLGVQTRLEDELEEFWLANPALGPVQRFFAAIHEVLLPRKLMEGELIFDGPKASVLSPINSPTINQLVIFVDELDVVRSLPFSTDEFFAAIRECYTRRTEDPEFERLTFCLLGVATPSDLIRDTRITPFNIGRRIELNDFTPAEAAPLAVGLNVQHSTFNAQRSTNAQAALERILYWTNGHPYLTQRLCRAVAERARLPASEGRVPRGPDQARAGEDQGLAELVLPVEGVDALCAELFFSNRAREQDDNLLFVRERLLRSDVDLATLLHFYEQVCARKRVPDDETNPLVSALRLSGITRTAKGHLQIRNRIYQEVFDEDWISANMPDAEVRRQKAAFRRGVLRTAGFSAVVLALVTVLALVAYDQSQRAQRTAWSLRLNLYASDMNVAHQAVTANNLGRAVRLLKEYIPNPGEEDLRGFEWRYLWQKCQGDELFKFAGHQGSVACAVISPDGRFLVTAGHDSAVKVWEFEARNLVTNLTNFRSGVAQVAFSPDGTVLAAAEQDDRVTLWDTAGWRLQMEINEVSGRLPIAFSPAENTLAVRTRSGVTFWDATNGKLQSNRLEVPAAAGYAPLAFSPDGRTLAVANPLEIQIWDVHSNSIIARCASPFFEPIAMTFSRSGDRLFAADWNGTVKIWSVHTGEDFPSKIADADSNFIFGMACSPDGKTLALAGSSQLIDLWDLATQTKIGSLKGHRHEIWTLAFAPDGQSLVSASLDGTAKLWRPEPKPEINTLTRSVTDVRLTLDGKSLFTMTTNGTIQQWDTHARQLMQTIDVPMPLTNISAQALSSDGELAAFALADGTMRILNLRRKTWNQTLTNQWGRAYAIEFAPRRPVLAAACSKSNMNGARQDAIELWDLTSTPAMTPYGELRFDNWKNKPTFSTDGERLAAIGTDDSVQIIEIGQPKARTVIPALKSGCIAMALSPDQSRLATAGGDAIRLWDMKSGRNTGVLLGHRQNVVCVTFSADGKTLASAAESGVVKLWSVVTGKELLTLHGFEDNQDAVVFSRDGTLLAGLGRRTGRGSVSLLRVPSLAEIDATLNLTQTQSSK